MGMSLGWRAPTVAIFIISSAAFAGEDGVVTPDELRQNQINKENTYHNEEYGFSIIQPEHWTALDTTKGTFNINVAQVIFGHAARDWKHKATWIEVFKAFS